MRPVFLLSFLALMGAVSEFDKYPAEVRLVGKPAPVNLSLPDARRFRTMLRSEAAQGPNFNGHYRIAYWGQGTGAVMWAVIDLSTGVVWFSAEGAGIGMCAGADLKDDGLEYFEHRIDSALFYVHTCNSKYPMNRIFNTRNVYLWQKGAATLLREESIK